ncbi:MAG: hypothetical protein O3B01_27610 [Planctomycetota bacterium]|nr:hypothetical protein [Planctomycetota bacterium]
MPSVGKMEAGSASKQKGSFRLFLNLAQGFDFEGGHDEDKGRTLSGARIDVPLHKHEVSLDVTRIGTELEYTFRDNWDIWLRIPYELKDRHARVGLVDPASPDQQAAMQRNLDLHHRNQKLEGFGDLKLLLAHRMTGVFRDRDSLDFAFGSSLPTGDTESDPFKAADAGQAHEHTQFGSGTFDPLMEIYYSSPVSESLKVGGFATGRFPFYENSNSYRGPIEITGGPQASYKLTKWLNVQASVSVFYQDYAYWSGERDINSGLLGTNATAGASIKISKTTLNLGVRFPVTQEALSDQGDSFEQGPTILFSVFHAF